MPRCDEMDILLDAWLDDALSSEQAEAVRIHLAQCEDCRRLFDRHRRLAGDLRALGGVSDRIGGTRNAVAGVPARKNGARRVLGIVAAMLVISAGSILVLRSYFSPAGPGPSAGPSLASHDLRVPPGAASQRGTREAGDAFDIDVDDSFLAVRMKSKDPTIQIVWLYNTPGAIGSPAGPDAREKSSE